MYTRTYVYTVIYKCFVCSTCVYTRAVCAPPAQLTIIVPNPNEIRKNPMFFQTHILPAIKEYRRSNRYPSEPMYADALF